MATRTCLLAACVALGSGCGVESEPDPRPVLDVAEFRCNVEPVLMARCGFYPCHGSELRPFRVYAPNRLREQVSVPQLSAPLTASEMQANFDMALGMSVGDSVEDAELLAKPLDADSGGRFHRGKTVYLGRDVFSNRDDLGYQRIAAWLGGAQQSPDCEPSTEVGP